MQQVVLNLLSNAMKFTKRGGCVEINVRTRGRPGRDIGVGHGVGIPPDKLGIVFEPFIQVDPSLTRQRDGTGLGLAISRQLARGMGGELDRRQRARRGSVFTLILPAATIESVEAPGSINTSVAMLSQARSGALAEETATCGVGAALTSPVSESNRS